MMIDNISWLAIHPETPLVMVCVTPWSIWREQRGAPVPRP